MGRVTQTKKAKQREAGIMENDIVRRYSRKPRIRFSHSEQQKLAIKLYWEDRRGADGGWGRTLQPLT